MKLQERATMKTATTRFRYSIWILFFSLLFSACAGGGGGSPETARVGLTLKVPSAPAKSPSSGHAKAFAAAPESIAAIGVSVVDAEGRLLTSTRVAVSAGQEVFITLEVPAGPARRFTVQAMDPSGIVLFQGEASADLAPGASSFLAIRMEPVNLASTLSLSPTTLLILLGKTAPFTATHTGPGDRALIWSVDDIPNGNPLVGTITPTGETTARYTAPNQSPESNRVTIKAASASNPELFATSTITLLNPSATVVINRLEGFDLSDCGSEASPCKTITQGLSLARAGQTLLVSGGTYTFNRGTDGESAPLRMKPGVNLQGAGFEETVLHFNGSDAPEGAGIVGADQTTLSGFTIQDDDSLRIQIDIDGGSPTISDNQFIDLCDGCSSTGIRVRGNARPILSGNRFGRNGSGLAAAVRVEDASPILSKNRFVGNGTAIQLLSNAAPKIEGNTITGNRIGLSADDRANPDLGGGASGSAGGNLLSCNTDADLSAPAAREMAARGNLWDHVPPRRGAEGNGVDLVLGEGRVDTAGASFAPAPCRVKISAPSEGAVIASGRNPVQITADADDPAGVAQVEFSLDGTPFSAAASAPYRALFPAQIADGPHTLAATLLNGFNRRSDTDVIRITVDNSGPAVSLSSPLQNATVGCGPVSIGADASDPVAGVSRVEFFQVGGAGESKIGEDTVAPYAASLSLTSNGRYTIRARAIDQAGNTGQSADVSFTYSCITGITISPPSATVRKGERQRFDVNPPAAVDWRAQGKVGGDDRVGVIGTDGTYTAPSLVPLQGNLPLEITVDAVLRSNGSVSNPASISILTGPRLEFDPNLPLTRPSQTSTDASGQRGVAFFRGQIYAVWSAKPVRADGWDVLFAESADGRSWTITTLAGGVDNQTQEPHPVIAVDSTGTVHIAYRAEKNGAGPCSVCPQTIELATRRPGDKTFSTLTLERRTKEGFTVQHPTLAVSPDGTVFAAWSADLGGRTGLDIHLLRIGKDGKPVDAAPRNLTEFRGAFNESHPVLSSRDGKEIFLAWEEIGNSRDIFAAASRDGGETFPFFTEVTDEKPGENPSLAAGPPGTVYIAWQTDGCGDDCFSLSFSSGKIDGGLAFSPGRPVGDPAKNIDQTKPSVAWNPFDGIYIGFHEHDSGTGNRIFLAKSIDDGASFSFSEISRPASQTALVKDPAIALDSAGRLFAVWTDDRNAEPQSGLADLFFSKGE